jgi:hypothetical protein
MVIKGDPFEADVTAKSWGVTLTETRYRDDWNHTYASADSSDLVKITRWYISSDNTPDNEPYSNGTLLFYSYSENENEHVA